MHISNVVNLKKKNSLPNFVSQPSSVSLRDLFTRHRHALDNEVVDAELDLLLLQDLIELLPHRQSLVHLDLDRQVIMRYCLFALEQTLGDDPANVGNGNISTCRRRGGSNARGCTSDCGRCR